MPTLLMRSGREIAVNESLEKINKILRQRYTERPRPPADVES